MSRHVALGDRGRVPFALVGVLLLVSSALFAAGVDPDPGPPEPAVDLAMERTAADTRAAVRQAASTAAVAAASEPVGTPADTPVGRAIANGSGSGSSFERALRLRTYLAARTRFDAIHRTHRGVTGRVFLAQPTTESAYERAIQRVQVTPLDGGQRMRVTVRNVTETAKRDGGVVGRRDLTITVVIDSPVLAVHERVTEFQERLDAGLREPGLTQKLTARLYAVAWARGYAQYGGAPIENVVSNRHVGLLTNGAVLGVQRSVFGRSDADGRRAHQVAVGEAALHTALGQTPDRLGPTATLLDERLRSATTVTERQGIANLGSGVDAPAPNETVDVSVGETAAAAFVPFTRRPNQTGAPVETGELLLAGDVGSGQKPRSVNVLKDTTQRVYGARVRTLAATESTGETDPARPPRPEGPGDWELEDSATTASVVDVQPAAGAPDVSVPENYHTLFEYQRRVTVRYSHRATWEDEENHTLVRRTYNNLTGTRLVRVAVVGRHAPTRYAPDNRVEHVHEPYPGAGRNLANVSERVNETVVDDRGGRRAMVRAATRGHLVTGPERVDGEMPTNLTERLYLDLMDLRREIRAIAVTVERGAVGTYETNPAALLAAEVRSRAEELVDAPTRYESVAAKAKYELRAMYVERVLARLERRAGRHSDQESGFATHLSETGGVSLGKLRNSTGARRVDGGRQDDELRYRVDGAPPYLTMSGVNHTQVDAIEGNETVYPLKAENVNVFTIPYGDATDGTIDWVAGRLTGAPRTTLRTGATAARAADSAATATENESVEVARADLTGRVNSTLGAVRVRIRTTLARQGVGESEEQRREIVDRAFARWRDPPARALAVANRTVVDAVVAEAVAHEGTTFGEIDRDILRVRLRQRVTTTLDTAGGTISGPVVTEATERVKGAVGNYTRRKLTEQVEQRFNTSISSMPAGLPVMPVPGHWVVTANVWVVNVRGEYERFAVETPRRTPTPGDASLAYVRDGENVTLDVDGDGTGELLGRSDRVGFDVQSVVAVVVPAGGTGVGDVDGNLQERSPGWKRVFQQRRHDGATDLRIQPDLTSGDFLELASGNATVVRTRGGYTLVTNETLADLNERRAANGTD
ncbi:MAG: hypothetical protein V5A44_08765 [Haloarculaceae archaeon]